MASSETPYRAHSPHYQAYDQSVATQQLLARMNPDDIGATAGMLFGSIGQDQANARAYSGQLNKANDVQRELARLHQEQAERERRSKTAVDAIQHGGAGLELVGDDLGLQGTATGPIDMARRLALMRGSDSSIMGARDAKALSDTGSGIQSLAQGGVQVVPGQSFTGGINARDLRMATHRPQGIEEQQIQSAATLGAARTNADAQGRMRITATLNPNMPNEPPTIAMVAPTMEQLRANLPALTAINQSGPPGRTPQPPAGAVPPPRVNPRVAAVLTQRPDLNVPGANVRQYRDGRMEIVVPGKPPVPVP